MPYFLAIALLCGAATIALPAQHAQADDHAVMEADDEVKKHKKRGHKHKMDKEAREEFRETLSEEEKAVLKNVKEKRKAFIQEKRTAE